MARVFNSDNNLFNHIKEKNIEKNIGNECRKDHLGAKERKCRKLHFLKIFLSNVLKVCPLLNSFLIKTNQILDKTAVSAIYISYIYN